MTFLAKHNQSSSSGFACFHGQTECWGNLIELCAIHLYPQLDSWFVFPFQISENSHM